MSNKSWNARNQRNYDRYFGDQYEKPTGSRKPNYSSDQRTSRPARQYTGKKYNRRGQKLSFVTIACIVLILLGISALSGKFKAFINSNAAANSYNSYVNVTSTVAFDDNEASSSTCFVDPNCIPDYEGNDCIVINNSNPNFTKWDYSNIRGQNFSKLDALGRCGSAIARLDKSMMPTEKRGDIGQIKPTGWVQNKYEGIINSNPPYLYNRSHLIAYALTGENANELNLITGTRYMNASLMLPWEEIVMRYLDNSSNHVLYRVTPYFKGSELLARGVEMEAYSIEDNGRGVCFHVFIYNIQPGIEIDYSTGDNKER